VRRAERAWQGLIAPVPLALLRVDPSAAFVVCSAPDGKDVAMTDDIAHLIEDVVRERFADVNIQSVLVVKDTDYQDEAVFRVTVVFDHDGPLDSRKTAGLVRHIRHRLLERQESTFPIVTFVSKSDAARMSPAAA
jgi:hypothetical protein